MKPETTQNVVSQDENVMSGALVFAGTRVRVQTLLDHLKRGYALDEFLRDFPSVTREQAEAFLDRSQEWARTALLNEKDETDARAAR